MALGLKLPKLNTGDVRDAITNSIGKVQDLADKGKAAAIGAGKNIKTNVDKAIKASGFARLLPVAPIMAGALKAKGITPPKNIGDLAISFHSNVVKKSSFDNAILNDKHGFAHFTEVSPSEEGIVSDSEGETEKKMSPEAIDAIIAACLSFIQGLRKKGDSGEKMTDSEKKAYDLIKATENAAEESAIDEGYRLTGEKVVQFLPWIIGVIALLWFARYKKWI